MMVPIFRLATSHHCKHNHIVISSDGVQNPFSSIDSQANEDGKYDRLHPKNDICHGTFSPIVAHFERCNDRRAHNWKKVCWDESKRRNTVKKDDRLMNWSIDEMKFLFSYVERWGWGHERTYHEFPSGSGLLPWFSKVPAEQGHRCTRVMLASCLAKQESAPRLTSMPMCWVPFIPSPMSFCKVLP